MVRFPACFLFWCAVLIAYSFCLTSCGVTTESSRTWYTRCYAAVRRIIYLACIYTYRALLPPMLLLPCTGVVAVAAAALRYHVPGGKRCCWLIESDSIQFFLFMQTRLIIMYPLAVLSHLRPRFAYTTSSVITVIAGIRGSREVAARRGGALLVYIHIKVYWEVYDACYQVLNIFAKEGRSRVGFDYYRFGLVGL